MKKIYPGLNLLDNREIGIYIELYNQALLDKDENMIMLAISGKFLVCLSLMYFNTRDASSAYDRTQQGNDYVATLLINMMAGTSAALTIFVARPIINIFGTGQDISIYDPMTLLGCFMAGLVSISASC